LTVHSERKLKRINILNKSVIKLLLLISLVMVTLPLAAQTTSPQKLPDNVHGLLRTANNAYVAKDYETFRNAMVAVNKMRPYNSDYMYQLVIAYALLDEKPKAYDLMLRMQQSGLSYDFSLPETTANIRGTQVFDYVNDLMKMAGKPMGESEPVFVLPDTVEKPETISWDESRQKFLIGTIAEGSILAVGEDGQVEELLRADNENGIWAILDMQIDQERKRLWVSSASIPGFSRFSSADKGRSALYELNLETLEVINRYPVPVDGQAHILGSMVLGANGDIYIVDRYLPIIYKKASNEEKLKPMSALRQMISLRGLALNADERYMYVAGREMGIGVVEMATGRTGKLMTPDTLNLGGIDGLYMKDNRLIVVQNGIMPQRVISLQLDPSGLKVTEIRPMAVAQPEFDYPNYGTLKGEDFYYFANSQLSGSAKPQKPVTVLRTPLNSAKELIQPDMRLFLEKQAQSRKLEEQKLEEEKD